MKKVWLSLALLLLVGSALAAPQTVKLSVPTMDCPVCPITIKKALLQVTGVSQAQVNFERKEVLVTFDNALTHVDALIGVTARAGYPSTLAERQP
ncbi:MAG: mercury resistance system periplasmic binding protein MerP [Hydrogenophaga sp.]|jgi:mercuric ion binding protein|uniref:mercury resistance system periplasmic binding protein MerP n=1 Tax=Hydrogenophaga sp. TaxID=1904254 RepID=UPI0025B86474|nr:mercury resistance system periplasmic binding protein MerP [Hydrogenophaga sp.]MBU4184480.1 mercury resistance system periplasmic binding protein MerP [Gammaproteobacteria bacterium]MBU4280884.1 mercury resistance system periplasmic binding protein MerP [Gammaproteobacteria bacterium]MBU4325108.1 mercury resistance system periplasmic binding protein MerP [Gammaproteobacteria bacterium]MBU4505699.1 mercury resistance system periplasmic binding protein MerP [Gammaproteobacteria bacterium]MCG2